MNKIKATKAEMRQNYRILSIGYCDAQNLLVYESPVAYSVSTYGWACDYYDINGVIISTGYNPLPNKNMKNDYKLIREYEAKAQKAQSREEHKKILNELLELLKVGVK